MTAASDRAIVPAMKTPSDKLTRLDRIRIAIGQWLVAPYIVKTHRRIARAEAASREALATNLAITKRLKILLPQMEDAVANAKGANVEATKARQAWATDKADRDECFRKTELAATRAVNAANQIASLGEALRHEQALKRLAERWGMELGRVQQAYDRMMVELERAPVPPEWAAGLRIPGDDRQ